MRVRVTVRVRVSVSVSVRVMVMIRVTVMVRVMVMVRVRVTVRVKGDEPALRAGAIARHSCRRCLLVPFALEIGVPRV